MAYSNSEVAHEFAHKTGNKQNGNSVFYEIQDNFYTIYSYGHHFAMASLLPGDKYGLTALFTEQSYSNSTAKHLGHVSRAISHFEIITVPRCTDEYISAGSWDSEAKEWNGRELITGQDLYDMAREDLKTWGMEIKNLVSKQARARKYDYSGQIVDKVNNAIKYAELFNVRPLLRGAIRKADREAWTDEQITAYYLGSDYMEELEEARKEQKRKEAAALKKSIAAFKNFERKNVDYRAKKTFLRVKWIDQEGQQTPEIQTSKGITIKGREELIKARKLFNCAKEARITGSIKNDCFTERLANYSIDQITSNGTIKTGCHLIPYSESEEAAKILGWI